MPSKLTKPTGHKKKAPNGYIHVYCPNHPNAKGGGYMLEHRLVVEASIGRFLRRGEVIHHLNEIKDDNRLENLRLCSTDSEHKRIHRPFKICDICGEIHNPGEHARTHCSKCNKVIRLGGRNHMPPICWECNFPNAQRNKECACSKCGKKLRGDGRRVWPALCQKCMFPESKCDVCNIGVKETGGSSGFCGNHYAGWRRWRKRGMARTIFIAKCIAFETRKKR